MRNNSIADNLAGTSWTLATLNARSVLEDTTVTLNFEDGRAVGSEGCNRYTTAYTADGATLKIQQPIFFTAKASAGKTPLDVLPWVVLDLGTAQ